MTGTRREAFSAFTFLVEIDGDQENAAYFRSVSGLKSEAEAVAVQEGGVNEFEHKLIEMIRNGQENVAIADRLHAWTLSLMLTADPAALPFRRLPDSMRRGPGVHSPV